LKKVLIISQKSNYGGIHTILKSLFSVFNNHSDYELSIFFSSKEHILDNYSFEKDFYRVYEIKNRFFWKYYEARKIFKQFDILHFNVFAPWFLIPILFLKKKILFTNHGTFGHGRKLKPYEHIKKLIIKIFLKYFVDTVISVSNYAKEDVIKQYKLKPEKNVVIYNITDWNFKETEFKPKEKLTLGFHGRFVKFKRVVKLFETAVFLNKNIPVKILLIGAGYRKIYYDEFSENYKIETEIVDYCNDVINVLSRIDYYILASKFEPFGISALESIAAGIPTFVLNDGGGVLEIFSDEFKWFICDSPQEISEKIFYATKNIEEIGKLFKDLQSSVRNKFSREYLFNSYTECYSKIISE
jgi:glycosyltransferase involved in cell wall biosynthesis